MQSKIDQVFEMAVRNAQSRMAWFRMAQEHGEDSTEYRVWREHCDYHSAYVNVLSVLLDEDTVSVMMNVDCEAIDREVAKTLRGVTVS